MPSQQEPPKEWTIQEYASLRMARNRMLRGLHSVPPIPLDDEQWLNVDRRLTEWLRAHGITDFEEGDYLVFEFAARAAQ